MNKKFNKPFIQAAGIILICILFISFGLATGKSSFMGNFKMIFSAFFTTFTFLISVSLAIGAAFVILVGIFLGATAIYSREKSRDLSKKIWTSTRNVGTLAKKTLVNKMEDIENSETLHEQKDYLNRQVKELSTKMGNLTEKVKSSQLMSCPKDGGSNTEQQQVNNELSTRIDALSSKIAILQEDVLALQTSIREQSLSTSVETGQIQETQDNKPE